MIRGYTQYSDHVPYGFPGQEVSMRMVQWLDDSLGTSGNHLMNSNTDKLGTYSFHKTSCKYFIINSQSGLSKPYKHYITGTIVERLGFCLMDMHMLDRESAAPIYVQT